MYILQTENLTKEYKQGDEVIYANKNVNIAVDKGEFVAIVGKSGSGKTTLLNLIGGIETPTSGIVKIDENTLYVMDKEKLAKFRNKNIGYVFQNYMLLPVLTAYENIIMPSLLDNIEPDTNYIKEITDRLGISDRLEHLPSELSGGQKQRVAIARALINKPKIILADEPTGNLDRKTSDEIMNLFQTINKIGNTIILVTHDEKYAELCTRQIHIDDGKIIN